MRIDTWPIPYQVENIQDATAVVIDVLRASTTIITALENGAAGVVPVREVDEAFEAAKKTPDALIAGERNALKVEGFDLGNSPFEFDRETVEDRMIVMTTTNGTQAAAAGKDAARLIVAGFVNADAVVRDLNAWGGHVAILCAGTRGRYTIEDAMCAGLLADRLGGEDICDFTRACRELYRAHKDDFAQFLMDGVHAKNLVNKGFSRDVELALTCDQSDVVPERGKDGVLRG